MTYCGVVAAASTSAGDDHVVGIRAQIAELQGRVSRERAGGKHRCWRGLPSPSLTLDRVVLGMKVY